MSLYAETKLAAEKYLQDKDCLIFRLGTVFGVSDAFARLRMDLAVNYMTANALKKGKLAIFGGSQWRPFIHVKDIGEIIVQNLENPARGIYNLSSFNIKINDMGKLISEITNCEIELTDQAFQDARDYHVSNAKAVKDNIFNPNSTRTIQDGVREISDIIQSGRIKYTEDDVYFNERHITNLIQKHELK